MKMPPAFSCFLEFSVPALSAGSPVVMVSQDHSRPAPWAVFPTECDLAIFNLVVGASLR